MSTEIVIVLPSLPGVRISAIELAALLPADCSGCVIVLDATATVSAAPGFVDELVHQMLQLRQPRALVFAGATKSLRNDVENAARRRNVFEPLRFERELPVPLAHEPRTWPSFTHVIERLGRTRYRPIGPEHFVVGHGFGEPVVPVTLVEDVHGEYMGWIYTGKTELSMVQDRQLFSIQFPNGHEFDEEQGKGEAVPLRLVVT